MKIAYACYWNAFRQDGVATKINTQVAAWRREGHEVEVFCLSPDPPAGAGQVLEGRVFPFAGVAKRAASSVRLMRAAACARPDAVYFRYDHFLPPAGQLLRRFPSIIEVNGQAAGHRRNPLHGAYSLVNERSLRAGASAFVCVSYDLAREIDSLGKPTTVIGNSVDLSVRRELPPPRGKRLGFALLTGAQTQWHGVDKVLWMAAAMPDCDFTMIGVEDSHLQTTPTENVRTFGLLPRERYEPLLAEADVALGALAMDRGARYENSSLKVPEYLAYGLPVILGYEETDFVGREPWYLLRLPCTPTNVRDHLDDIRAFAQKMRGTRVPRAEIADIVGTDAKEARRLEFIAQVASR